MRLVIVDIDGTLTETNEIDAECYLQAVSAFLGRLVTPDWSTFSNVTDSGVLEELCREHLGRSPTSEEVHAVRERFVAELQAAWRERPQEFRAVAGAVDFIERCPGQGWDIALATGGWAESARLKLRAAGLPTSLPLASADVSIERIAIVREAVRRAEEGGATSTAAALIGDALWDLETAQRLGLLFIGIATGHTAERLRSAGAAHVYPDLRDLSSIFAAMALSKPEGA